MAKKITKKDVLEQLSKLNTRVAQARKLIIGKNLTQKQLETAFKKTRRAVVDLRTTRRKRISTKITKFNF